MAEAPKTPRLLALSDEICDLFDRSDATPAEGLSALMWTIGSQTALELYESHARGGKATAEQLMVPLTAGILAYTRIAYNDLVEKGRPDADQKD